MTSCAYIDSEAQDDRVRDPRQSIACFMARKAFGQVFGLRMGDTHEWVSTKANTSSARDIEDTIFMFVGMDYKFEMKKVPGYGGRVLEMRDEGVILVNQPSRTIYSCFLFVLPSQEDAKQAIRQFLERKAHAVQQAWIDQGEKPAPRTDRKWRSSAPGSG